MRIVMLLCISFLSYQCFGGQLYSNMNLDFSFELPDGWNYTPVEELSEDARKRLSRLYNSQVIVVLQKGDGEPFSYPCIQVEFKSLNRSTDSEAHREVFSEEGKRRLLESTERLSYLLTNFKTGDFTLTESANKRFSEKNAAYAYQAYQHKDGREFIVAVVKLLGPRKIVNLRCFEKGADTSSFLSIIDNVIDSFEFESRANTENDFDSESYSVQNNVENTVEVNSGLPRVLFWGLPIGVLILVVFYIFRRWTA